MLCLVVHYRTFTVSKTQNNNNTRNRLQYGRYEDLHSFEGGETAPFTATAQQFTMTDTATIRLNIRRLLSIKYMEHRAFRKSVMISSSLKL